MIVFLLWVIVLVIAWPIALALAAAGLAFIVLRVCLGITVLALKVTAASVVVGGTLARRSEWPQRAMHRLSESRWVMRFDHLNARITKMPSLRD